MKMKSIKLMLSVTALTGALSYSVVSQAAETVISKDVLTQGSYCHTKFESVREETLASSQPVLKDVDDLVDFYGACDHNPLSKEEIEAQKIEEQHRFAMEYEDWKFCDQGEKDLNLFPPVAGTYDQRYALHPYLIGRVACRRA